MAYCTQADLAALIPTAELVELTTDSGSQPDAAVIAEAIAKAGAVIDAYCGGRYAVPLAPVPDIVKTLCVDLAIYHLYSRRDQMPEIRRQKYEDAMSYLKDIAKGVATLGAAEAAAAVSGAGLADLSSQARVFDRDKLSGW